MLSKLPYPAAAWIRQASKDELLLPADERGFAPYCLAAGLIEIGPDGRCILTAAGVQLRLKLLREENRQ